MKKDVKLTGTVKKEDFDEIIRQSTKKPRIKLKDLKKNKPNETNKTS